MAPHQSGRVGGRGGGVYEIIWHYQLSREWGLATVKRLVKFRLIASTISLRILLW